MARWLCAWLNCSAKQPANTALDERQQGRRLHDLLRAGDTLVVRWVDRLGRNYQDVTDTIRAFMREGVVIKTVINGMTFDGATQDPIQQAVRADRLHGSNGPSTSGATREAQRAGIAAARAKTEERKRCGMNTE